MPVIKYLTAGQLDFSGEPDGKALRASIDNAGQNLFYGLFEQMYKAASEKLRTYMDPVSPQSVADVAVTDAMKSLRDFNSRVFSNHEGATGSVDKSQMKTYLSLVHAMQPTEQELTAIGMDAGTAKAIAGITAKSKAQVERALKVLQLDPPMTEAELQQNVPVLLASLAQGKGTGVS